MSPLARPAAVSIRAVSKSFGGVSALNSISLDIAAGEFFSLLGPSGCGKTTLMRAIAGFEQPDSGSVHVDGVDMASVPPHSRPVNMMFQNYALFPHITVADNIAFGLKRQRLARAEIRRRLEEMIALVQLEGLAERKPHQLSGGQRQRVALARALARGPKVLLLDEPLAALDKKLRQETQLELKRIQASTGAAFVVVTHDQDEAMALSDRLAIMRAGRIVQIGEPGDVYDRPADRYVAGFVGDVNLFEATLGRNPSGLFARIQGFDDDIPADGEGLELGAAVVALRPERLVLARERTPAADRWLEATIIDRTHRGPHVAYRLRSSDGRFLQALAGARMEDGFAIGAAVLAGFRICDLRFLRT